MKVPRSNFQVHVLIKVWWKTLKNPWSVGTLEPESIQMRCFDWTELLPSGHRKGQESGGFIHCHRNQNAEHRTLMQICTPTMVKLCLLVFYVSYFPLCTGHNFPPWWDNKDTLTWIGFCSMFYNYSYNEFSFQCHPNASSEALPPYFFGMKMSKSNTEFRLKILQIDIFTSKTPPL